MIDASIYNQQNRARPAGALDRMSKLMQLRNMLQQGQAQQQAMQGNALAIGKQQQDMQEQAIIRQAYGEAKGDIEKLPKLLAGKVSPSYLISIQKAALDHRKAMSDANDSDLKLWNQQAKITGDAANFLKGLPLEKRAAVLPQVSAQLSQLGIKIPDTVPSDDDLDMAINIGLGTKEATELEIKKREQKQKDTLYPLQERTAKAGATEAENKATESGIKLETEQAERESWKDWHGRNPGKTYSDYQIEQKANLAKASHIPAPGVDVPFSPEVQKQKVQIAASTASARNPQTPIEETTVDPQSQSILAQTGLSFPAFQVLTGQAGSLPRDKATRAQAMSEAGKWANKKGVDISTMASQYKTYNEVLSNNISRMNNTKIMEGELQGTIENLRGVVKEKDLGKLKVTNVIRIWGGQEVNDDLAQQYAIHLSQLRNELSAYYAATQGRTGNNITIEDKREADNVIKNGIAKGSLEGFATAIDNSTKKMGVIMQNSVNNARKLVWNLFGVGANYKPDEGAGTPKASAIPPPPKW